MGISSKQNTLHLAPLHCAQLQPMIIIIILCPFWTLFGPFWGHFGPILDPQMASGGQKCRGEPAKMGFSAFPAETENRKNFEILTILSHLWPLFGPFWTPKGLGSPQMQGGTGQNGAKMGSTGHKNVFWDRLRPFGYPLSAFPAEIE